MAVTSAETHPALHQWPRPEVAPHGPEHLAKVHIEEAETLAPALEAFIRWEMKERNRFVFQGAWITPEFAARKCAESKTVRAVFIDEPVAGEILASMLVRSGRTEPSERQLVMSQTAFLYGNWIRERAQQLGLPCVAARPRETLAVRILAAAG